MLSNAYYVAKFRFDTAENEPAKNLQKFRKMHFRKMHFRKSAGLLLGEGEDVEVVDGLNQIHAFIESPCVRSSSNLRLWPIQGNALATDLPICAYRFVRRSLKTPSVLVVGVIKCQTWRP